MRVAFNAVLLGGDETGVEVYIRTLLRYLARIDEENEYLVFLNRDVDMSSLGLGGRFTTYVAPFSHGQRLRRVCWEQFRLPDILRREKVDVLHAPAYVMPLRSPAPCVVTMHDVLALTHRRFCKRLNALHYGVMLPRTASRAARIITSTQTTKEAIVERLRIPPQKVVVINPGVQEGFYKEEPSRLEAQHTRLGLPDKYILFVGRLEPKKNVWALLTAFRWLQSNRTLKHKLVLIGPHECSDTAVAKLLTEMKNVVRLGYLSTEELRVAYNLADVFVFPSLAEGFGFPPLEAMACGTPVVASNIPVLRETLGEAALLVPPDEPNILAIAIYKVLSNAFLHRTLSERGLERASRYKWENTARQTVQVYKDAFSESQRRA